MSSKKFEINKYIIHHKNKTIVEGSSWFSNMVIRDWILIREVGDGPVQMLE